MFIGLQYSTGPVSRTDEPAVQWIKRRNAHAFKHARRQLQDQVRRAQGQVKHHEGLPAGTVVRLDPSGEFGFLETSDGQEVYFHRNSVLHDGFSRLRVGSRVTFAEELGEKGAQATTVKLLGKHKLRA